MKRCTDYFKSEKTKFVNAILVLGVLIHASIILKPIIQSPFSGDDTFDTMVPMQLRYSGQSPWSFIHQYVTNWSTQEGRFFPVAAIVGFYSHYLFPGRTEYKIAQILIVLIALLFFGMVIYKLFKSFHAGIIAVVILNTALQMRVPFDPLFQFSFQQPSLVIMLCVSLWLFIDGVRKSKYWILGLSAIFFLLALLTYESTILFWPIYLIIILVERPKKYMSTIFISAAPAIGVGLNLLYLRSKTLSTSSGYTSNFELLPMFKTFGKQAIGSIPLSYSQLRTPPFLEPFPDHLHPSSILWLVAVGVSVTVISTAIIKVRTSSHRLNLWSIAIGMMLWLTPALVVGQTSRWQNEVVLGNAYISWFQGALGFSLVLTGSILEIRLLTSRRYRPAAIFVGVVFALVVGVATSAVVTNNPRAVAQFNPGYLWPRETFESAIEVGVFDEVGPENKVLALGAEWWLNAPFIYWWGGPRINEVISQRSTSEWQECVAMAESCIERGNFSYVVATYGTDLSGLRAVMVGNPIKMQAESGVITSTLVTAPRFFIDYPLSLKNESASRDWCLTWGVNNLSTLSQSRLSRNFVVIRAKKDSCLLKAKPEVVVDVYKFNPNQTMLNDNGKD